MGRLTDSDSAGRGVLFLLREFGRLLVDAFLPGALAGALLAVTLREVSFYSGWIGVPGTALAVVALEAAVGAAVIGYCRERFPGVGPVLLSLPLFAFYCLFPVPMVALAVTGIGVGGWLTALPAVGAGASRFCFGSGIVAAAAGYALFQKHSPFAPMVVFFLLAPVMAVAILRGCRNRRPWFQVVLVCLFPLLLVVLGRGMVSRAMPVERVPLAPPSLIRAALPASLLPDRDGLRVLFLSDRVSALPRVWVTLPYVERIECVWPSGVNELEPAGRKVKISRRAPGLGALSGRYDLIFIEGFGPVSPASKRLFVELLQRDYLTAPNGVLVLPRREAASLPPGTIARPLPGAGRYYLAVGSSELSPVGLEELDQRLQRLQGLFGEEVRLMPPGIFEALFYEASEPAPVITAGKAAPGNFWPAAGLLLAAYALVRFYFGRLGRNNYGFALFENGAAFALILVVAVVRLDALELTGGIAGGAIWASLGVAVFHFAFRPRAEWMLSALAAVSPAVWLLSGRFLECGGGYWLVVLLCALSAGVTRARICRLAEFPRTWNTLFCGVGVAAGAVAAALLVHFLPDPVLPAVVFAAFFRLGWLLRI